MAKKRHEDKECEEKAEVIEKTPSVVESDFKVSLNDLAAQKACEEYEALILALSHNIMNIHLVAKLRENLDKTKLLLGLK